MNDSLGTIQQLANAMPLAFWASEGQVQNYKIVAWNDAAEELYGYSKEQAVGTSFLELFVQPFARAQAAAECDAIISGSYLHPRNCIAIDRSSQGDELLLLTNVFRLEIAGQVLQAEISVDLTTAGFAELIDSGYRRRFLN